MDFLQIALIFLILLLAGFLSVLGIQVFFILSELRKSLTKLEKFISEVEDVAKEVQEVETVLGNELGIKRSSSQMDVKKPVRRLFKRQLRL